MKNIAGPLNRFFISWLTLIIFSCTGNTTTKNDKIIITKKESSVKRLTKPPGTYRDTLTINLPAAVFYYSDSIQLEKVKEMLDTKAYKGILHDCFFQMRYAHEVIRKEWPRLTMIEAKHYRYFLFTKKDGSRQCIDLDTKNDVYGLFLFDGKKPPLQIDLTSIDTQASFYFKH